MKLPLTVNGNQKLVEILAPAPACRFRLDDGPERTADVRTPEPGVYSILIDGRSYDAWIEETSAGLVVVIDGYSFAVQVLDPRRWHRKSTRGAGQGPQAVSAPMPGKVVRVLVSPGDPVEPGQGLVVVEAMKMQNELRATRAARVLSVSAAEGATVAAGEVLVTLE
jgi:biotin carboxyl carrier protein